MLKKVQVILWIIILGVSLNSCYEIKDLCLDELASNFDVAGDTACDECCTYPTVTFQVLHKLGDVGFGQDSVIYTLSGDSLKLSRAIFFVDDVAFELADEDDLYVWDEGIYETFDGEEVTRKNDDALITTTSSFIALGSMRENGNIEAVLGQIGISHTDVALEEESLLYDYDSLYVNSSYLDMKLYMKIGDSLQQDISVGIRFDEANILIQDTVLEVVKIPRENFSLRMNVNYLPLLESLDLAGIKNGDILENIQLPTNFLNFYR